VKASVRGPIRIVDVGVIEVGYVRRKAVTDGDERYDDATTCKKGCC